MDVKLYINAITKDTYKDILTIVCFNKKISRYLIIYFNEIYGII